MKTSQPTKKYYQDYFNWFRYTPLILLFLVSCSGDSNEDGTATPDEINSELVDETYTAADLNNELMSMLEGTIDLVDYVYAADSSQIVSRRDELLFELEINRNRISNLKFEEGGAKFIQAVDNLFDFYEKKFSEEFDPIVAILIKGSWTDEEDAILVEFDETFATDEEILYVEVIDEQEVFSERYKIQLIDRTF